LLLGGVGRSKLPHFGYALPKAEVEELVIASLREVSCSPKEAGELARWLNGCKLSEARDKLEQVIEMKTAVPFRRHKKKVPHRKEIQGFYAGRYPVKAARLFQKLLDNLENNATFRGMDPERLKIVHFSVHSGRKIKKYIPRAFGRATPYFETLVHVEVAAREV